MTNVLDEEMMALALDEAVGALRAGGFLVGAVIATGEDVIVKSGRTGKGRSPQHAEVNAIRLLYEHDYSGNTLRTMTLYTTLEPCIMCVGTILNARIGRVVYALEDPYGGATCILAGPLPPRHARVPVVQAGVLRDGSRELLASFIRSTDLAFWQDRNNELVRLCLGL